MTPSKGMKLTPRPRRVEFPLMNETRKPPLIMKPMASIAGERRDKGG